MTKPNTTPVNEEIDPRRLARYRETASRLGMALSDYLLKGASGKRYCTKCQKWKRRSSFLQYGYEISHYTGTCKSCRGGKRKPAKIEGRLWGPAVLAATKLGIAPQEYVARRQKGERWCTTHQGWFDANEIINSPRYLGGNIIRCRPCMREITARARK